MLPFTKTFTKKVLSIPQLGWGERHSGPWCDTVEPPKMVSSEKVQRHGKRGDSKKEQGIFKATQEISTVFAYKSMICTQIDDLLTSRQIKVVYFPSGYLWAEPTGGLPRFGRFGPTERAPPPLAPHEARPQRRGLRESPGSF